MNWCCTCTPRPIIGARSITNKSSRVDPFTTGDLPHRSWNGGPCSQVTASLICRVSKPSRQPGFPPPTPASAITSTEKSENWWRNGWQCWASRKRRRVSNGRPFLDRRLLIHRQRLTVTQASQWDAGTQIPTDRWSDVECLVGDVCSWRVKCWPRRHQPIPPNDTITTPTQRPVRT